MILRNGTVAAVVLGVVMLAGGTDARGDLLAEYTFGPNPTSDPAGDFSRSVSFTADNVSATTFAQGSNNALGVEYDANAQANREAYRPVARMRHNHTGAALSLATTPVTVTLTAADGYVLDLREIRFLYARGGSGNIRHLGFKTNLDDDFIYTSLNNAAQLRPAFSTAIIPLTDSQYQGITSITLQWYAASNSSTATFDLDDIQVYGSIIPEPASMALLGLGGLVVLRRRR